MREELIESIKSLPRLCCTKGAVEVFADHLIANGVTVQKWIPVSERLPEDNEEVVTYRGRDGIGIECRFGDGSWGFDFDLQDSVTHWMPLPEPPKGE